MKAAPTAVLALMSTCTLAQERAIEPAPPTPAETQQVAPDPARAPIPELVEDIDMALARARAFYRSAPIAERIDITLTTAAGEQRRSTVTLRVDAGSGDPEANQHPRVRRLFIDLGRLQVTADTNAVTAISPRQPSSYFRAPVTAPLTLNQLWNAIPPIPLPQFEWALGEGTHDLGRLVTAILQTSWVGLQHTKDLGAIFIGVAPGGGALAHFTREGRLVHLSLPLGSGGDLIDLKVTPEDPATGPWTLDTATRQAVPSIADLRQRPPDIQPGARLPALSLMNKELDSWSLQDELDKPVTPDNPGSPTFGLIIAYRPAGPTAIADAELGARALTLVRRNLAHAQPDPTRRPRLHPLVVGFLDLPDMTRPKLAAVDAHWSTLQSDPPPRYFSPTGAAEMERLARTPNAAVLVIDSSQKILAIIPLENRPDAEHVANEIEGVLDAAARLP